MKPAPYNLMLKTANRDNILTLTTVCGTSCVFCSHHQNPPEVEAYYVEELGLEEACNLIEFLDGDRKIVIGESATRICEGEPFKYKYIIEVLKNIREKLPKTLIQITTSGVPLDEELLEKLKQIGGIELNISLNSSNEEGRKKLFSGNAHMEAVRAVEQMRKYKIPFTGSIVAMPHIVGWQDIKDTVSFLAGRGGAESIRIFMPGYTKYSKLPAPPENIREELQDFVVEMRKKLKIPIILEPSGVKDLNAIVEGVVNGSSAKGAGLKAGDRILKINGEEVISRVDAYYKLYDSQKPLVHLDRDGEKLSLYIRKQKEISPGAIFNYDIGPSTILDIEKALGRNKGKNCLLLTSELAYELLIGCIKQNRNVKIEKVKNSYFGGNIMCAGLLTIEDISLHLKEADKAPEVVFLPAIMFDSAGRDLTGADSMSLEDEFNIKVEII